MKLGEDLPVLRVSRYHFRGLQNVISAQIETNWYQI